MRWDLADCRHTSTPNGILVSVPALVRSWLSQLAMPPLRARMRTPLLAAMVRNKESDYDACTCIDATTRLKAATTPTKPSATGSARKRDASPCAREAATMSSPQSRQVSDLYREPRRPREARYLPPPHFGQCGTAAVIIRKLVRLCRIWTELVARRGSSSVRGRTGPPKKSEWRTGSTSSRDKPDR
jgi:hypothetical protein